MVTQHQCQAQTKAYIRAAITITLIVVWNLAVLTSFLLYLGPSGPRSGWLVTFFLTKGEWKDALFWTGMLATFITVINLGIDWLVLQGCIRYLVSIEELYHGSWGCSPQNLV